MSLKVCSGQTLRLPGAKRAFTRSNTGMYPDYLIIVFFPLLMYSP